MALRDWLGPLRLYVSDTREELGRGRRCRAVPRLLPVPPPETAGLSRQPDQRFFSQIGRRGQRVGSRSRGGGYPPPGTRSSCNHGVTARGVHADVGRGVEAVTLPGLGYPVSIGAVAHRTSASIPGQDAGPQSPPSGVKTTLLGRTSEAVASALLGRGTGCAPSP